MTNALTNSSQRIQAILARYNLAIKVIEFSTPTRTAQEAANAIGCEIGQIAKTLIFSGKESGKPICVIASGKNRVDEDKIIHHVGEKVDKPDAEFVVRHTSFAIGGVPPIGFTFESAPLVDEDLMAYQEVWAAAGTPFSVFKITPQDLLLITQGRVANTRK